MEEAHEYEAKQPWTRLTEAVDETHGRQGGFYTSIFFSSIFTSQHLLLTLKLHERLNEKAKFRLTPPSISVLHYHRSLVTVYACNVKGRF